MHARWPSSWKRKALCLRGKSVAFSSWWSYSCCHIAAQGGWVIMSSTRSGGRAAANAGGEKKPEEEHDDDEVYQYPRQGLGPVFASIESLLRW